MGYGINDIQHLDTREAMRTRIQVYLGSDDTEGCYQALKEIINNATDEALAGYGKKIKIKLDENKNEITVLDEGRGVPFGIKDGKNVLVSIYTESHTGGKFTKGAYKNSSGLNGLGGTAVCMTSKTFKVTSCRQGKSATAYFEQGVLKDYKETPTKLKDGTTVTFIPDKEVFKNMTENYSYDRICDEIKRISYFNKGISFEVSSGTKKKEFLSKNGIADFINEVSTKPLMKPIFCHAADETDEVEIAFMWTSDASQNYTFVNSLEVPEGGAPVTGAKTALTTTMKKLSKKDFDAEVIRKGLIYVINCKVAEPSFANQTKSKINNANLRTLASQAFKQGLEDFAKTREFDNIIEMLNKVQKADAAAEKARKQVLEASKEIEKNASKKVFNADKLKDAEHLGKDAILLICEGDSAASGIVKARDYSKYGVMAIRGKMINSLANPEEHFMQNEEIKLLLKAMNIVPGKYDARKLRYGKLAICTDADSDGAHIGLLIMANLYKLAPQFIEEGRLCWLRSPLWIVKENKTESYYFTDAEMDAARPNIPAKAEIQRNKGLGSLSPEQAKRSMFMPTYQRLDTIKASPEALELLEALMGEDIEPRREYVFNNIDFSTIRE